MTKYINEKQYFIHPTASNTGTISSMQKKAKEISDDFKKSVQSELSEHYQINKSTVKIIGHVKK